jgi:alkaline phosphatase D
VIRGILVIAAIGGCRGLDAEPPPIRSTFSSSTEGWTLQGFNTDAMDFMVSSSWTGTPLHDAAEGALRRHDLVGITDYFQAPPAFLGDLSAFEGGSLTFEVREDSVEQPFEAPLLLLDGAGMRWRFAGAQAGSTTWRSYTAPLGTSSAGWTRLDGTPATGEALQTSLGAVTALWIRGEFSSAFVDSLLDDVTLAP